jgi:hypothetical protein
MIWRVGSTRRIDTFIDTDIILKSVSFFPYFLLETFSVVELRNIVEYRSLKFFLT